MTNRSVAVGLGNYRAWPWVCTFCSSVPRNAAELPVNLGIPVSQRGDLSQYCDDGSALVTMKMT